MPARNAAVQSAFQNSVAIFIRAGLGTGEQVERGSRSSPINSQELPRIAKSRKLAWTIL